MVKGGITKGYGDEIKGHSNQVKERESCKIVALGSALL